MTGEQRMVSEQLEAGTEMSELLGTLLDQVDQAALAAKRRDPDIPEGEILAEVGDENSGITRQRKQSSMVSMNGKKLPERFAVYDRANRIHMVPTAAMMQMLAKPNFRAANKGPWPGVPIPKLTDVSCDICNKVRREEGNNTPRRFWSEDQVEPHMRGKHGDEHAARLAAAERASREEDTRLNREMLAAMMELIKQGKTEDADEMLANAGIVVEQVKGLVTCPDCGKADLRGSTGLGMHQRRWCKKGN